MVEGLVLRRGDGAAVMGLGCRVAQLSSRSFLDVLYSSPAGPSSSSFGIVPILDYLHLHWQKLAALLLLLLSFRFVLACPIDADLGISRSEHRLRVVESPALALSQNG